MADTISDFYPGTTKKFTVECQINSAAQDITGDIVTFRIKELASDSNDDAVLTEVADVATEGASGIAIFDIAKADTELDVRSYVCDVEWILAGGAEYIVYSDDIKVLQRVSDE